MFVNASILLLGAEFGRAIRREEGEEIDAVPVSPEYVAGAPPAAIGAER
jgi:hypothetical protein